MRPGQKNRMRGGRSNNNNSSGGGGSRRGPNPLTRSYESNGPDVKVRGTPQHIAEKYVQLARDAHTSSDTVMAESYLQHAEHYYRIIAAAQYAQQVAYNQANGLPNPVSDEIVDDEDEFEVAGADRFTFRAPQNFQQPNGLNGQNGNGGYNPPGQQSYGDVPGGGDQPPMPEGQVLEAGQPQYQPRPPRQDRPFDNRRPFEDRGDRNGDRQQGGRDRQNRRFGRDRNFGDRPNSEGRPTDGRPYEDRAPQGERPSEGGAPAFVAEEQPGLPSFITAPVRITAADEAPSPGIEPAGDDAADGRVKTRRRRRPRAEGAPEPGGEDQA
jgi:Domain of unknown function (DUF4167)